MINNHHLGGVQECSWQKKETITTAKKNQKSKNLYQKSSPRRQNFMLDSWTTPASGGACRGKVHSKTSLPYSHSPRPPADALPRAAQAIRQKKEEEEGWTTAEKLLLNSCHTCTRWNLHGRSVWHQARRSRRHTWRRILFARVRTEEGWACPNMAHFS